MDGMIAPLVWQAVEVDRGDGSSDLTGGWTADADFGEYVIDIGWGSDCYYWSVQDPNGFDVGSDFDDFLYAKAAAQADYEARIMAALNPAWLARQAQLEADLAATLAANAAMTVRLDEARGVLKAIANATSQEWDDQLHGMVEVASDAEELAEAARAFLAGGAA